MNIVVSLVTHTLDGPRARSSCWNQDCQCSTHQTGRISFLSANSHADSFERITHRSFTEAQAVQCLEGALVLGHGLRLELLTVARAIGMAKPKPGRDFSVDSQLPAVHRPMVRGTQYDQIVLVVRSALGTRFEVMQVDEAMVTAAGHDAATVVAAHHLAAKRAEYSGSLAARDPRGSPATATLPHSRVLAHHKRPYSWPPRPPG